MKPFSILTSDRRLSRLATSPVYDLYWRFAAERQKIFFGRIEGTPPPWTTDDILQTYRFTNAYRASDRVSQFLIREVIYNPAFPSAPTRSFSAFYFSNCSIKSPLGTGCRR